MDEKRGCEWCGSPDIRVFDSDKPLLCRDCYTHYKLAFNLGWVACKKAMKCAICSLEGEFRD